MTPTNEARPAETGEANVALGSCSICHGTDERPILRDDGVYEYIPCGHNTPDKPVDLGADAERETAIEDLLVNDPVCGGRVTCGTVRAIAALSTASVDATIERAALIAEQGYRCRTCDAVFTEVDGHPDPGRCSYPNWDRLTESQIVAAIRDLSATPTHPDQEGGK